MEIPFENVVVLKGGPSAEREVSLVSGAAVAKGLRTLGLSVTELDVRGHELELPAATQAVFIALHGTFGEDGQVQALLRDRGVPYIGSGPESSRLAFDKVACKDVFTAQGIPTAAYEVVEGGARPAMDPPFVIKPPREGSSVGIHKVSDWARWNAAAADCLQYDERILVEAFLPGAEFTVGILCDEALPVVQIEAPGGWYDYDAKYTHRTGDTQYRVPAPLSAVPAADCQDLALRAFRALGCRTLGRVDLRCDGEGRPQVLEVNTIPGFTERDSLLPKAAAQAGIPFPDLCGRILADAAIT